MSGYSFLEAIKYAESRGVVLPEEYYGKLAGIQRQQAVSIAGLGSLDQIKFVIDKVNEALKGGQTFKEFQDAVRAGGVGVDLPKARLDNIFRTNMQVAYARGRWEQQERVSDSRPYLMYSAIDDSRVRPTHLAWSGTILPRSNPFWATHYPPNGYRCRCSVISLTKGQAEKRGISKVTPPADPDDGWGYNPGADYGGGVDKALNNLANTHVLDPGKVADAAARAEDQRLLVLKLSHRLEGFDLKNTAEFAKLVAALPEDSPLKYLSPGEMRSLFSYTTRDHLKYNEWLRSPFKIKRGSIEYEGVQLLLDAIAVAAEEAPTTLYRAIDAWAEGMYKQIKAFKPGQLLQLNGVTSTSANVEFFNEAEKVMQVPLKMHIKTNGAKGVSVNGLSRYAGQDEWMLPPYTVFRCLGQDADGVWQFEIVDKATLTKAENKSVLMFSALTDTMTEEAARQIDYDPEEFRTEQLASAQERRARARKP